MNNYSNGFSQAECKRDVQEYRASTREIEVANETIGRWKLIQAPRALPIDFPT